MYTTGPAISIYLRYLPPYLTLQCTLPSYHLGRGVDSKRLVHTLSILASGARQSRRHPHTHNTRKRPPNSGRRCFPIGPWSPALGPEPLFRRVAALLSSLPPVARRLWLARSNIGAFSQKFGVAATQWGNKLSFFPHSASMGPRWTRRVGRGHLDRAPDPQIGGPGPRTKGRGREGQ